MEPTLLKKNHNFEQAQAHSDKSFELNPKDNMMHVPATFVQTAAIARETSQMQTLPKMKDPLKI